MKLSLTLLFLLSSCAFGNTEKKLSTHLQSVSEYSDPWQKNIDQNLKRHADGEDFGTTSLIGVDLYTLVSPLAKNNIVHLSEFAIKNNVNFEKIVGAGLSDFIKGKGKVDIQKFVSSNAIENFLPGKIIGDKNIVNYMGFLIGISKGKISPNLLVALYYTYDDNNQSAKNWTILLDKVAQIYDNNKLSDIAPLQTKTLDQNRFLQLMNLSLAQSPEIFAGVLDIISNSKALEKVDGLKYFIDEKNESVSFFNKNNTIIPLIVYYPFLGKVAIGSEITPCKALARADVKDIYQTVKDKLLSK